MKKLLKITVPVDLTSSVTDITFNNSIMVSLDCSGCSRCRRSVVIDELSYLSYCTPTKHKFDGSIIDIQSTKNKSTVVGTYIIEYEFEEFTDKKYPERIPKEGSTWARAKYTMRCKCGVNTKYETQNNIVRPYEIFCKCGNKLAKETYEIPIIESINEA